MSDDYRIDLVLDTTKAHAQLDAVEAKKNQVQTVIKEAEETAKMSFGKIVTLAHQSWFLLDSVMRAAGIQVGMQFRLLVRVGFAAVQVLTPILSAQAVTPGQKFQAAVGLLNIGIAIAALAAAGREETQVAMQLAAGSEALANLNTLIGSYK